MFFKLEDFQYIIYFNFVEKFYKLKQFIKKAKKIMQIKKINTDFNNEQF